MSGANTQPPIHIQTRPRTRAGFTLLEMMLVVVIIGLLATVVVVNLTGSSETARVNATKGTLSQVKQAVQQYNMKHGSWPISLQQLATGTNPLLERVPQDAWRHDLLYITPGIDAGRPFSLYSMGVDGQPSTPDDINIWTMEQME